MKIGITDNMGSELKLQLYTDWLSRSGRTAEYVVLSYREDNLGELSRCDGLLLTGGGDVDPRLYGGDPQHTKLHGVDSRRDDFERKVIDGAIRAKKPILGICRGLQIVNVHIGGTLVQDLDEAGCTGHTWSDEGERRHGVVVEPDSILHRITGGVTVGEVNSYHHQAADLPAPGLRVSARAADGVAEAIEPASGSIPSFLLLVQWHPERMADDQNVFSHHVRESFYNAIEHA